MKCILGMMLICLASCVMTVDDNHSDVTTSNAVPIQNDYTKVQSPNGPGVCAPMYDQNGQKIPVFCAPFYIDRGDPPPEIQDPRKDIQERIKESVLIR